MVDDGLCCWQPLAERLAHHQVVIDGLKRALAIGKIEIVIPTHYHGDHTENIPELVAREGTEVVGLDIVTDPIEHPERFNLAATLPWYGTACDRFRVDRKLANGARFRWREFEFEMFHLGGQTYYALGLAVDIRGVKTLFVGDAIAHRKPLCPPILCYNKADPATAGWAYAIERMLERKPDLLVCGHGDAIRNPVHSWARSRGLATPSGRVCRAQRPG